MFKMDKNKYKIVICDDSKEERYHFYERQFDNFDIYGVTKNKNKFIEIDPIDSVEKLYNLIKILREKNELPDLILLDLFYKRKLTTVKEQEQKFKEDINNFKNEFYRLKQQVNTYLEPTGLDLLKHLRQQDFISSSELLISTYTDKNFNFLLNDDFNLLYELNPESLYKYRGNEDNISSTSEYLKIVRLIESNTQTYKNNNKIFISHGKSNDWKDIQIFIEKDLKIETIELAQQVNAGNTIIEKLIKESNNCNYAIIVMTGDDTDNKGNLRSRENVMHEIGFFQGKYGRNRVCILHEENTSIPTNLSGIAYIPYRKGDIKSIFNELRKELQHGRN
jgi:hypothetical protein